MSNKKLNKVFKSGNVEAYNPYKVLLINVSSPFSSDRDSGEYDVLEPPLGLIALLSYLNREFKTSVKGKIIKTGVDFDSYKELNKIIKEYKPQTIGVSTMTFHKDFFHKAIASIRQNGYKKMLVVGGPHPTTSYQEVIRDKNIDLCVLGEGEATFAEIIEKLIKSKRKVLDANDLGGINGIAFSKESIKKEINHKTNEFITNKVVNG